MPEVAPSSWGDFGHVSMWFQDVMGSAGGFVKYKLMAEVLIVIHSDIEYSGPTITC